MDTQTILNPLMIFAPTDLAPVDLAQACSRDYGFDFDEEEIGREMLAPLPAGLSTWRSLQLDADESQNASLWFLS